MSGLILIFYVSISALGLMLLRKSFSAQAVLSLLSLLKLWQFWLGSFLYGSGFLIWLWLLSKNNLSFIFPVAAGGLVVATSLCGVYFLGEKLSVLSITGIVIIVIGITCAFWGKT